MKCTIPSSNVKILARAIHALAKIGEEMYVMPRERSLSFRSVSMSNSAYCDFTFQSHFFTHYNYGNLTEDDALKCKVPMRAALAVFKTPGVLDKLIETCHVKLEPNATKLIMVLKYKNSVIKTFLLPIIDCEALQAAYNKDNAPNKITVVPKILTDALHNFQQNLVEITLDVVPDKILMRNYINETSTAANSTRTQLALAIGEFNTYSIGQESCITFCLKELRAILTFAEIVATPINILFEDAGKPAIFIMKNPAFEGHLVLSTLNPNSEFVPDTTIRDKRQAAKKRAAPKSKQAPKAKAAKTKESEKTSVTINNILGHSVLNNAEKNVPRQAPRKRRENDSEMEIEPQLVSAVRSTSLSSRASKNGRISNVPSPQPQRPPVRPDFIAQTPSSTSSTQSSRSAGSKETPSIFTESWKRQGAETEETHEEPMEEDVVPNSPPRQVSKNARMIFRKCFQSTFDPRMLPGYDTLLADDSDEEKH